MSILSLVNRLMTRETTKIVIIEPIKVPITIPFPEFKIGKSRAREIFRPIEVPETEPADCYTRNAADPMEHIFRRLELPRV